MTTRRVRTGPTSYLNLNDDHYKAWKSAGNKEYVEPEAKQVKAPAEDKAQRGPAQKKADTP